MSRARQNSQSQSKVSLENQSRKQQKQQQERKIETDHQQQSMDRTDVMILVEILLPSASRFIAMNRMSLLHSTARTFWVTMTVSSQSSSLTTGLCWHLVALIPSSACGPSVKSPSAQFKWKLDTALSCTVWPLLQTTDASSVVDSMGKSSFTTCRREYLITRTLAIRV